MSSQSSFTLRNRIPNLLTCIAPLLNHLLPKTVISGSGAQSTHALAKSAGTVGLQNPFLIEQKGLKQTITPC
jgi:hypothetical protein